MVLGLSMVRPGRNYADDLMGTAYRLRRSAPATPIMSYILAVTVSLGAIGGLALVSVV